MCVYSHYYGDKCPFRLVITLGYPMWTNSYEYHLKSASCYFSFGGNWLVYITNQGHEHHPALRTKYLKLEEMSVCMVHVQ